MKLEFSNVEERDHLVWPQNYEEFSRDSPALSVFTDFKVEKPLVIESSAPAYEVEEFMLKAHVKLKLVVDEDNQFLGVVALSELQHPDFLARIAAVYTRDALTVEEVMRPRDTLEGLSYEDLEKAVIGDVLDSLKDYKHHHCLVIDRTTHEIRGLISVSNIARRLKIRIQLQHTPSFAELYLAVLS